MGAASMSNLIHTNKKRIKLKAPTVLPSKPNREVISMHKLKCTIIRTPTTATAQ